MKPKPASDSTTIMNEIVLPSDSNGLGTAFGGKVMQWIDICGAITALRHCRRQVVTASMDELHFHAPIKTGTIASLRGVVSASFKHSLEVVIEVHSEDPESGDTKHCCSALLTFVALDDQSRPTPVPPLLLRTPEEKRIQEEAALRRKRRLEHRQHTAHPRS